MEATPCIPVVDFSSFAIGSTSYGAYNSPEVVALSEEILKAFTQIGFVYLVNTGIKLTEVEAVWDTVGRFFHLPDGVKEKYVREKGFNYGWVGSSNESLNPGTPGDLKETFNVTPQFSSSWPLAEVPGIREEVSRFWAQCQLLTNRLLRLLALCLKLEDVDYFIKCHHMDMRPSGGDPVNQTGLRFLHYPPIQHEIIPGQLRCGEHSDWGTLTLLFQDQVGGLQVLSRGGMWTDATPIPGTVLVNIGDMLQRWTSNSLISTRHRVVTANPSRRRISTAFFCNPNLAHAVCPLYKERQTCVTYDPVTYGDYLEARIRESLHARHY